MSCEKGADYMRLFYFLLLFIQDLRFCVCIYIVLFGQRIEINL